MVFLRYKGYMRVLKCEKQGLLPGHEQQTVNVERG